MRQNIYDLDYETLKRVLSELGQPAYRAGQIWRWLYQHLATDFGQMTNIPSRLQEELAQQLTIPILESAARQKSNDKQTVKELFVLPDGNPIETVLMRYDQRRTLCISTQVGCGMGCVFCATGQMGFSRNLSAGEIISQVIHFARELAMEGDRVTNIVMMGMGEPLHNYDNTIQSLDTLTDDQGFNLGARKITISTVGLVPAIYRYADERRQTPLAVSLHAATDEERSRLIPINRRWPLDQLMEACRYYVQQTGRRLTFEWALIDGDNDTAEQAHRLGALVKGLLCHVNLIPLNPTTGYPGKPSSKAHVAAFQDILARYAISSTVRVRRGIDIQAGCGQLRDRVIQENRSISAS